MLLVGVNVLKQKRGKVIVAKALQYGATNMARNRRPEEIEDSRLVWNRIITEVNQEFPNLPRLTIESAKNSFRHYKRDLKKKAIGKISSGHSRQSLTLPSPTRSVSTDWTDSVSIHTSADNENNDNEDEIVEEGQDNKIGSPNPMPFCDRIYQQIHEQVELGNLVAPDLANLIQCLQNLHTEIKPLASPKAIVSPIPMAYSDPDEEYRNQIESIIKSFSDPNDGCCFAPILSESQNQDLTNNPVTLFSDEQLIGFLADYPS